MVINGITAVSIGELSSKPPSFTPKTDIPAQEQQESTVVKLSDQAQQLNRPESTIANNQDGFTRTRNTDLSWNKETGTGAFTSTSIGSEGSSQSISGSVTKTDAGFASTATITKANGETLNVSRTATKNDDGTVSVNQVATNVDGQSLTSVITITKTDTGYTSTDTRTNGNSVTSDVNRTATRNDDGSVSVNQVVTKAGGQSRMDNAVTKIETTGIPFLPTENIGGSVDSFA